jgi:hypothetical protein
MKHPSLLAQLMLHVSPEPNTGCWLWTGALNNMGYGRLKVGGRDGKSVYAHRVAYQLFVGPIPDGKVLDHRCSNTWCCNPAHLDPTSQADNVRRGRASWVSEETVGRVREMHESGLSLSEIGRRLSLDAGYLSRLTRGLRRSEAYVE